MLNCFCIEFGKKAYQLNPNDPRILFGYGEVLALSGRGGEALEYLLKAHELSPHIGIEGNVDVLISSVVLGYFSDGNYEECINWFKTLEKKDFRSFVLYISSLEKLSLLEDDSAQINVFKQKFGDILPEGKFETLGGYIISEIGRIPNKGETLYLPIGQVIINKSSSRRISQIKIILKNKK